MLDLAASGRTELKVVDDQRGRPTFAPDLARALVRLVAAGARGVVHFANAGETTWYGLAKEALARGGFPHVRLVPCTTAEFPRPAARPANSVLDTSLYETARRARRPGTSPEALDEHLRLRAEAAGAQRLEPRRHRGETEGRPRRDGGLRAPPPVARLEGRRPLRPRRLRVQPPRPPAPRRARASSAGTTGPAATRSASSSTRSSSSRSSSSSRTASTSRPRGGASSPSATASRRSAASRSADPASPGTRRRAGAASPATSSSAASAPLALSSFVAGRGPSPAEGVAFLLAGLAGAAVESLPSELDDNLVPPLAATGALAALLAALPNAASLLAPAALRQLLLGLAVNVFVSSAAALLRVVRPSGALAGGLVGTLVLGLGGWGAYALLWVFFAGGTLATRFGRKRKEAMGKAEEAGGRRGAANVLANCSVAAFLVACAALTPGAAAPLLLAAAAAFATALMDTVGTEVGQALRTPTVLLPDFRRVPPGTDGAVSVGGHPRGPPRGAPPGGPRLPARPLPAVRDPRRRRRRLRRHRRREPPRPRRSPLARHERPRPELLQHPRRRRPRPPPTALSPTSPRPARHRRRRLGQRDPRGLLAEFLLEALSAALGLYAARGIPVVVAAAFAGTVVESLLGREEPPGASRTATS